MTEQPVGLQHLGRYSGVAVALSVIACYGTLALTLLLSTMGVTLNVHEGAWATAIVVFAGIAVLAIGVNIPQYRSLSPFIIADVGALLVSWACLLTTAAAWRFSVSPCWWRRSVFGRFAGSA